VRLYYLDESEGQTHYVRSAIGISADIWSKVFLIVQKWRKDLWKTYHVPLFKELHASDLLAGRGHLIREGKQYKGFSKKMGATIFAGGLQTLENTAQKLSEGLEIINVSLEKSRYKRADMTSLERMLNRINTSAKDKGLYAFLIFDEGKEKEITRLYRKALIYNPVPSKYGAWENGKVWKNIPPKNIVGGPSFRSSQSDYFIQMADFVAHALLKKDEPTIPRVEKYNIHKMFDNILDLALNKKASEDDPKGVVRR